MPDKLNNMPTTTESYFSIHQTGIAMERPPISYLVRTYFERFITEHVLVQKKLVIGGKWKILLVIHFTTTGPMVLFKGVALGKGARTIGSEHLKMYNSIILTEPIQEAETPFLKTIELMYEAITLFFTRTYKKVTPAFMRELWEQLDINYLLSLPYPAPLAEQKYSGDTVLPDGTVQPLQIF